MPKQNSDKENNTVVAPPADPTKDVTAEVQAAIDAGSQVNLPAGEVQLSTPIQLSESASIQGTPEASPETTKHVPQPPPGFQLVTLDEKERAYHDKAFEKHQAKVENAEDLQAKAEEARRAKFAYLAQVYPLTKTLTGSVWRHSVLGESKYIEVAVNGGYFDPRGMPMDYRPDLDFPKFEQSVDAMVVG